MNKFLLRHQILHELYELPKNPSDKEYPKWILSSILKDRIDSSIPTNLFLDELGYLSSDGDICTIKQSTGELNVNLEKEGRQRYIDKHWLDKRKFEVRENIQYRLKVTAWVFGIFLGAGSFGINIYRTFQDIQNLPVLKYRIETLENSIKSKETTKTYNIQSIEFEKKDSLIVK